MDYRARRALSINVWAWDPQSPAHDRSGNEPWTRAEAETIAIDFSPGDADRVEAAGETPYGTVIIPAHSAALVGVFPDAAYQFDDTRGDQGDHYVSLSVEDGEVFQVTLMLGDGSIEVAT